jgi:hypothetical protein
MRQIHAGSSKVEEGCAGTITDINNELIIPRAGWIGKFRGAHIIVILGAVIQSCCASVGIEPFDCPGQLNDITLKLGNNFVNIVGACHDESGQEDKGGGENCNQRKKFHYGRISGRRLLLVAIILFWGK